MNKFALRALAFIHILLFNSCEMLVNKMAFHPDKKNVLPKEQLPPNVQEIFIETEDRIKIQGYYIPNQASDKILIYFHGNAGNISHRLPDLLHIHGFGINILGNIFRILIDCSNR